MEIRDFFATFNVSAAGLRTQKNQLAITAENIANATTTKTSEGTPYRRKYLLQRAIKGQQHFSGMLNNAQVRLATSSSNHISGSRFLPGDVNGKGEVAIENEVHESQHFKKVYDPNHPDADEEGIVRFPDVNVINEMLELIGASRLYEANITMMNASKNLARRALEI